MLFICVSVYVHNVQLSIVVDIAYTLSSRDFVFETESGVGLYHFHMKDLQPSQWIDVGIVNCFVSMQQLINGILASHLSRAQRKQH
ncbi:hypothetical protein Hanom_Chr12g01130171 [Helianthus anomalus]